MEDFLNCESHHFRNLGSPPLNHELLLFYRGACEGRACCPIVVFLKGVGEHCDVLRTRGSDGSCPGYNNSQPAGHLPQCHGRVRTLGHVLLGFWDQFNGQMLQYLQISPAEPLACYSRLIHDVLYSLHAPCFLLPDWTG